MSQPGLSLSSWRGTLRTNQAFYLINHSQRRRGMITKWLVVSLTNYGSCRVNERSSVYGETKLIDERHKMSSNPHVLPTLLVSQGNFPHCIHFYVAFRPSLLA